MKKHTLIIALIILSMSYNLNGQNLKKKFGIKTGANYSQFTPDYKFGGATVADYKRKVGFYLGGLANIEISEKLKIQPELLFAIQGSRLLIENIEITDIHGIVTIYDYESDINESVINIPVVLQYYFTDSFYMETGPQFGYIISRQEKIKENPFESFGFDSGNSTYESGFDKIDLDLTIGTGYKLSDSFVLNARFFFGLIERDNAIKTSVFNLGIEYKL